MPNLEREQFYKFNQVAGVDEVGRGCIAGPVVAAAVILPNPLPAIFLELDDSKKLTATKRDYFYQFLTEHCDYGIGQCSVTEIDTINILQASLKAMQRAVEGLKNYPYTVLIDGNKAPALTCKTETIVKGDSKSLSIAAASIIAKVHRDRLMAKLHEQFPVYNWKQNKGYPSPAHKQALQVAGLTKHHRLSFAPCKNIVQVQVA